MPKCKVYIRRKSGDLEESVEDWNPVPNVGDGKVVKGVNVQIIQKMDTPLLPYPIHVSVSEA
jgi:hypothetical protein